MKKYKELLWISMFALVFASGAMAGPKELNREDAEKLIKGNTAEGTNRWGKNMVWYFDESGQLKKWNHLGIKGKADKAEWRLDDKGELCYQDKHMNDEKCVPIISNEDGSYEVPLDAEWKWIKVVPGNPYNL